MKGNEAMYDAVELADFLERTPRKGSTPNGAVHRIFPPPGHLVDIGGQRLHLMTAGEGSPTVVIIPALGESVPGWLGVVETVAARHGTTDATRLDEQCGLPL